MSQAMFQFLFLACFALLFVGVVIWRIVLFFKVYLPAYRRYIKEPRKGGRP